MRKDKHKLSEACRKKLKELRKSKKISAEDVSVELGYSKSWLGKIESGKQQTIKQDDLVALLDFYIEDKSYDEIIYTGILDNFLHYALILPSHHEYISKLQQINIPAILYKCIEQGFTNEQQEKYFNDIQLFLACIMEYPTAMTMLLSNMETLYKLFGYYYSLDTNRTLNGLNTSNEQISSTIKYECEKAELAFNKYLTDYPEIRAKFNIVEESNKKENG